MKKFVIGGILLLFSFVGAPLATNAAVSPPPGGGAQEAQRWVCLNAVLCSKEGSGCGDNQNLGHSARLTVKDDTRPLPEATTYIVECLTVSATRQICTTGSSQIDAEAFGAAAAGNLAKLQAPAPGGVGYQFQGIVSSPSQAAASAKTRSNSAGAVGPFEWISYTPGGVPRKFLAMNKYTPRDNKTGDPKGQQQGTFNFDTASTNCVSISWDPYGRVFDSQSLEPIPQAAVTLLKRDSAGAFSQADELGITNPQTTQANGEFSFVVSDGVYKLMVAADGYIFPNIVSKLHPAFSKAYSDVYRGEEIVQSGKIEHRDIPIDTGIPGGKQYSVDIKSFHQREGTATEIIEGAASHPFTKLRAVTLKYNIGDTEKLTPVRGRVIKEVAANKDGTFRIEIDKSTFTEGEFYGLLEWEKVDLRAGLSHNILQRMIPFVHAQETSSARFEPILTYIEGYAYDATGNVMSRAKVGVYLTFSDLPYYETSADEKGYYKISSELLPFMDYKIRYQSATGSKVEVTTSKFLAQNAKFLSANKINVNQYRDSTGVTKTGEESVSPSSSFPIAQNKIGQQQSTPPAGGKQNALSGPQNPQAANMLLLTFLVLLLLGASAALLGFYLYNKNKVHKPSL